LLPAMLTDPDVGPRPGGACAGAGSGAG